MGLTAPAGSPDRRALSCALLGLCGSLLWAGGAAGEEARGDTAALPVELVAALPGSDGLSSTVFVGRSGQLYRPAEDNTWQRRRAGGVSVDVVGALRGAGDRLFVVGRTTPLFERHGDSAWAAYPLPNRGPAHVAPGARLVSIGRHIYRLDKGRWVRLASVDAPITALFAAGARRIYAATRKGALKIGRGKHFATVHSPLDDDDRIVRLVGGKEVYAVSAAGALLWVKGRKARPVKRPEELSGFEVQAAGTDGAGRVLLAGVRRTADGATALLVEARKGALAIVEPLEPLADGDQFAVILGTKDQLLVASRRGEVRIKNTADQDAGWQPGRVRPELPETRPDGSSRRFEAAGPAHTR